MRSAYGFKIPEIDPELTRVGPGTPCGELMRRYWQPVCLSRDLGELPKRIRKSWAKTSWLSGTAKAGQACSSFAVATGALLWSTAASRGRDYDAATTDGCMTWRAISWTCPSNLRAAPSRITSSTRATRCRSSAVWSLPTWGLWRKMPELPKYDAWIHEGGKVPCPIRPEDRRLRRLQLAPDRGKPHGCAAHGVAAYASQRLPVSHPGVHLAAGRTQVRRDGNGHALRHDPETRWRQMGRVDLGNGHALERSPGLHEPSSRRPK